MPSSRRFNNVLPSKGGRTRTISRVREKNYTGNDNNKLRMISDPFPNFEIESNRQRNDR